MDPAGMLSKQKLKYIKYTFIACILFIFGCNSKMVNYNEIEKPTAVKKGEFIEIKLESVVCSECWIKPSVQMEQETIYISGKLVSMSSSLQKQSKLLSIKVADQAKQYRLFWVDRDGKKTEIPFK